MYHSTGRPACGRGRGHQGQLLRFGERLVLSRHTRGEVHLGRRSATDDGGRNVQAVRVSQAAPGIDAQGRQLARSEHLHGHARQTVLHGRGQRVLDEGTLVQVDTVQRKQDRVPRERLQCLAHHLGIEVAGDANVPDHAVLLRFEQRLEGSLLQIERTTHVVAIGDGVHLHHVDLRDAQSLEAAFEVAGRVRRGTGVRLRREEHRLLPIAQRKSHTALAATAGIRRRGIEIRTPGLKRVLDDAHTGCVAGELSQGEAPQTEQADLAARASECTGGHRTGRRLSVRQRSGRCGDGRARHALEEAAARREGLLRIGSGRRHGKARIAATRGQGSRGTTARIRCGCDFTTAIQKAGLGRNPWPERPRPRRNRTYGTGALAGYG